MTTLPYLSSNTLNTDDLLGLSLEEAKKMATEKGWKLRVAKHNNITYHLVPTQSNAVTISIENDMIVTAKL